MRSGGNVDLVEEAIEAAGVIVTEDLRRDDDNRVDSGASRVRALSDDGAGTAEAGDENQDEETDRSQQ
jgi:hypothetical protein